MRRSVVVVLASAALVLGATSSAASATAHDQWGHRDGLIAFQAIDPDTGNGSLGILRPGSGHARYPLPGVQVEAPTWSPNGKTIAYDSGGGPPPFPHVHLFTTNAYGHTPREITFGNGDQGFPSYDPIGRFLAFDGNWPDHSSVGFHSGLGIVNVRTGRMHEITRNPYNDCGGPCYDTVPAWSPDGRLIAFERVGQGGSALATVRVNGTHLHLLTTLSVAAGPPDWSPNGRWIVYDNNDEGQSTTIAQDVLIIGRHGGTPYDVTKNESQVDYSFQPSWSPNGRRIVYSNYHSGDNGTRLFVSTPRGTDRHALNVDAPVPIFPDWGNAPRRWS